MNFASGDSDVSSGGFPDVEKVARVPRDGEIIGNVRGKRVAVVERQPGSAGISGIGNADRGCDLDNDLREAGGVCRACEVGREPFRLAVLCAACATEKRQCSKGDSWQKKELLKAAP